MKISFRLPSSRERIWALASVLALGVYGYGCGGGGSDCTGPFCLGPEKPQATKMKLGAGNGQTGAPGRDLPQPVEVIVTDNDDKPIQDVAVSFSVGQGGGSLSGSEIHSDVQGRARATWTLGPNPGDQSVEATATGASGGPLSGAPLTFTAQAVRPPPARLVLRQAPSVAARSGAPLDQQPIVEVLDSDDQAVPQMQVTAAIASGGGTLSGTTAVVSDAAGRAAYSDLALVGPSGPRTLRFSIAEPPLEAVSGAIIVGAGGPARITGVAPLTYQGTVGSPVDPGPSVIVKDAAGNPVPGISVSFTADRDASVSPEATNTDDHGIAQVTSWTLGTSANLQYTLTARVEGSSLEPVRFTAMARAGAAGGLRIATQPSASAQNGLPFPQQPAIQVVDGDGNPAPQANVQITASIAAGPSGVLQNAMATTDAGGLATFSGLTLTGTVGNYTISFSAQGLAGAMSNPIALAAGGPTQLAFVVAPPTTARSRAALTTQPVIQVQDASGNPVGQADILIVASVQGGATLSGETAATDAAGKATFTQLAIIGAPGQKTLSFGSPNPLQPISAQVTLPPVASIAPHPNTPASGTVGTTLTAVPLAILTDVSGRPVADAAFTLTFAGGTVSLLPLSGISGVDGSVTADSWQLGTTTGDQLAQIDATGAVSLVVHLQAMAAAPALIQIVSGDNQSVPAPPATETDPALPDPLVVQVTDQYGNGVGGAPVQWRTCDGAGTYDQATDANGFSSSRQPIQPGATPGTYCTRASVAGSSVAPVNFSYTITPAGSAMNQSRTSRPGFRAQGLPPSAPRPSDARRPQPR